MKPHDKMIGALKRPMSNPKTIIDARTGKPVTRETVAERFTPKEANFAFSGDFEDDEPELMQCDCCGEMKPVDDIDFIPWDARGNSAGCDTYQCQDCAEKAYREMIGAPTEAEIARSQARIAAVLGLEEIAKLDDEAEAVLAARPDCCLCGKPIDGESETYHGEPAHERCKEQDIQDNWKYRP